MHLGGARLLTAIFLNRLMKTNCVTLILLKTPVLQVFIQDVLGEIVPSTLSDQIFSLVGGGGRGVTFRELLTLLVLVTRGTREEKFKCKY